MQSLFRVLRQRAAAGLLLAWMPTEGQADGSSGASQNAALYEVPDGVSEHLRVLQRGVC